MKKKLLLHICCGPCAIYVWQKLQMEFEVSGFFYNPNIQPFGEFEFRRLELVKLAERFAWAVTYFPYEPRGWFAAIRGLEREAERGARCPLCFRFRLEKAFQHAREHGFDAVASTLSISPSKRTAQINEQGYVLAEATGVAFIGEDFKKKNGFLISRRQGKELGVKHQDYCGCVYSKVERLLRQRPR
ncbi:MAG: epoxyqueuosine reductase QueH [Candidatus Aminicenantes bacterium]|nr:epoxyqueuosine reductase QueH [Candidatus Aminicenantes bacterium]